MMACTARIMLGGIYLSCYIISVATAFVTAGISQIVLIILAGVFAILFIFIVG